MASSPLEHAPPPRDAARARAGRGPLAYAVLWAPRLVWALSLAGPGCTADRSLELPAAPSGASAVLVVARPDGLGEARVVGAVAEPQADVLARGLALAAADRLYLVYFDAPLEALGLRPGRLALAEASEAYRPLPEGAQAWTTALGDHPAWTALPAAEVPVVRLPALHLEACVARGGCFTDDSGICRAPCPPASMPAAPRAPASPERPRAAACPAGWTLGPRGEAGVELCAPRAVELARCTDGERWSAAAGGCVPVGAPCPSDDFGPAPDDGRPTFYVRAGATAGDGSRAAPFATLAEALASPSLPEGARLLLARGRHAAAAVRGRAGLELRGACAAGTAIAGELALEEARGITLTELALEGPDDPGGAALRALGSGVELIEVRLHAARTLLDLGAGTTATIARARLSTGTSTTTPRGASAVWVVAGARLSARELELGPVARAAVTVTSSASGAPEASLTLRDALIRDAPGGALSVGPGGALDAQALVALLVGGPVVGVRGRAAVDHLYVDDRRGGAIGATLDVLCAGRAEVAHALVLEGPTESVNVLGDAHFRGLSCGTSADAALALRDSALLLGGADATDSRLELFAGRVELRRVHIEGHEAHAINANNGALDAEDLVIDGLGGGQPVYSRSALWLSTGSTVRVRRARFERLAQLGVQVLGDEGMPARLRLEDVVLADTSLPSAYEDGAALYARGPAELELERVEVTDSVPNALLVREPAAPVRLTDVRVRGGASTGISLDGVPGVALERVAVAEVLGEGLYLSAADLGGAPPLAGRFQAVDLHVAGTAARPARRALMLAGPVPLALARFRFERAGTCFTLERLGPRLQDGAFAACDQGVVLPRAFEPAEVDGVFRGVVFAPDLGAAIVRQ